MVFPFSFFWFICCGCFYICSHVSQVSFILFCQWENELHRGPIRREYRIFLGGGGQQMSVCFVKFFSKIIRSALKRVKKTIDYCLHMGSLKAPEETYSWHLNLFKLFPILKNKFLLHVFYHLGILFINRKKFNVSDAVKIWGGLFQRLLLQNMFSIGWVCNILDYLCLEMYIIHSIILCIQTLYLYTIYIQYFYVKCTMYIRVRHSFRKFEIKSTVFRMWIELPTFLKIDSIFWV